MKVSLLMMTFTFLNNYKCHDHQEHLYSPADKKNYCDRVDQSMKLGMQVRFGIYNSIRRGAKKNCLIKTKFLKCEKQLIM